MKDIVYAPAALASLQDILEWTIGRHGDAQAERYTNQLIARLDALAAGQPPHPRPCSALLSEGRRAPGLGYVREGRHYLILRETETAIELVEVFHERMNIEAWLQAL
ncbi:type II toxin-antitoxin system RelE/ParE family toxin [Mangrovicoccus ximenensis]|uniref:type II toxin-antitoxin system RelE/ParE family toxin n=1 Tax=Mangrovicoccus ximenensis TaxID=1911570 RepID=UPI000D3330A0|nr:type II toxin-antitoxin system RelE/ParE family toxin [Mangrovicoccus ximenensis]